MEYTYWTEAKVEMLYLDNAATTKPNLKALEKASEFLTEKYFNPSALYDEGVDCNKSLKYAREFMINSIGAINHNLIFTSCGTESNNTAIFGVVKRGTFVADEGEHASVYNAMKEQKNRGNDVYFAKLNKDGSVNVELLLDYIKNNKVDFVSIMHVNNETGAINDVNYIASEVKKINEKIVFMSDGVQAFGKIPNFKLSKNVDLYSVSAHKIGGLKGVGALFFNKKTNITPLLFGGGQECGQRSGTENLFGIKVFEYALADKMQNVEHNYDKVKIFNDYVRQNLTQNCSILSGENACPYILSIAFRKLRGEIVMHLLNDKNLIVGNGSACSSKKPYSRVIEACGIDKGLLNGVLRISFSPDNTLDEIKEAVKIINEVVG